MKPKNFYSKNSWNWRANQTQRDIKNDKPVQPPPYSPVAEEVFIEEMDVYLFFN